jgi:hypothetical protein
MVPTESSLLGISYVRRLTGNNETDILLTEENNADDDDKKIELA